MTQSQSRQSRIIRGFAALASGTMVSRATGMLREMALAFYLGSGAAMDAFVVAFTLPNLFRRILGEKVLESAVLPTYKHLQNAGRQKEADDLIKSTLMMVIAIGAFVTGIGMVFTPWLIRLFAPGFDIETHILAVKMGRIMFPFLILISVAAMFGVILQSRERFGVYGIVPAVFNVAIIVCLVVGLKKYGPEIAAWGVLIGGFLEGIVMIPIVRQTFHFRTAEVKLRSPAVRKVNHLAIPVFLETLLDKTIVLVDRRLASIVSAGSISALGYAFRLLQLPYGILVLALARTFYQHLVDASTNVRQFTRMTGMALRSVMALMIPCATMLMIFSELLVRIVYQRGAFGEQSVRLTTSAFACYGIGIIGMTALAILTRAFNALCDTRTPVKVSIAMMAINIVLNYILVRTSLQHAGLALASSIAYWFAGIALFVLLRRKLQRMEPQIKICFNLARDTGKIIVATVPAALVGWKVAQMAGETPGLMDSLIYLGGGSIAFSIVYLVILKVLKLSVSDLIHVD